MNTNSKLLSNKKVIKIYTKNKLKPSNSNVYSEYEKLQKSTKTNRFEQKYSNKIDKYMAIFTTQNFYNPVVLRNYPVKIKTSALR